MSSSSVPAVAQQPTPVPSEADFVLVSAPRPTDPISVLLLAMADAGVHNYEYQHEKAFTFVCPVDTKYGDAVEAARRIVHDSTRTSSITVAEGRYVIRVQPEAKPSVADRLQMHVEEIMKGVDEMIRRYKSGQATCYLAGDALEYSFVDVASVDNYPTLVLERAKKEYPSYDISLTTRGTWSALRILYKQIDEETQTERVRRLVDEITHEIEKGTPAEPKEFKHMCPGLSYDVLYAAEQRLNATRASTHMFYLEKTFDLSTYNGIRVIPRQNPAAVVELGKKDTEALFEAVCSFIDDRKRRTDSPPVDCYFRYDPETSQEVAERVHNALRFRYPTADVKIHAHGTPDQAFVFPKAYFEQAKQVTALATLVDAAATTNEDKDTKRVGELVAKVMESREKYPDTRYFRYAPHTSREVVDRVLRVLHARLGTDTIRCDDHGTPNQCIVLPESEAAQVLFSNIALALKDSPDTYTYTCPRDMVSSHADAACKHLNVVYDGTYDFTFEGSNGQASRVVITAVRKKTDVPSVAVRDHARTLFGTIASALEMAPSEYTHMCLSEMTVNDAHEACENLDALYGTTYDITFDVRHDAKGKVVSVVIHAVRKKDESSTTVILPAPTIERLCDMHTEAYATERTRIIGLIETELRRYAKMDRNDMEAWRQLLDGTLLICIDDTDRIPAAIYDDVRDHFASQGSMVSWVYTGDARECVQFAFNLRRSKA